MQILKRVQDDKNQERSKDLAALPAGGCPRGAVDPRSPSPDCSQTTRIGPAARPARRPRRGAGTGRPPPGPPYLATPTPRPVTPKPPSASLCQTTELVLPNDTNTLGNLMGGRLLHLMDVCAAISAQRHANRTVVTASVDSVDFRGAIALGEVVVIEARVNRAFTSSMEVGLTVWAERPARGEPRRLCNTAFYTFVAVDQRRAARPGPAGRAGNG